MGAGQTRGGASDSRNEIILKQNTKYAFRITSTSATNNCSLVLDWYEHTDSGVE
jgi:hypothetical protein